MAFLGMINWTYIWFRKDGPINQEQFADLAVEIFLNGFMTLNNENLPGNNEKPSGGEFCGAPE